MRKYSFRLYVLKIPTRFFDQDGNDQISSVELSDAFTNFGEALEDGEIDGILGEADEDNDAQVNFEEFVKMMLPDESSESNGQWFYDHLETALTALGQSPSEDDLNEMVSDLDEDGNGNIDILEFEGMLEHVLQESDDSDEANEEIRQVFELYFR